jgi:hypothetical protein
LVSGLNFNELLIPKGITIDFPGQTTRFSEPIADVDADGAAYDDRGLDSVAA